MRLDRLSAAAFASRPDLGITSRYARLAIVLVALMSASLASSLAWAAPPPQPALLVGSPAGSMLIGAYDPETGGFLGSVVDEPGGGPTGASALAVGPAGDLYFVSEPDGLVLRFALPRRIPLHLVAPVPYTITGLLNNPTDLAFGPSDGHLYVAAYDGATDHVLRYQGPNGAQPGLFIDEFVSSVNNGGLSLAFGLAFGPADGNLYVSSHLTASIIVYDGTSGAPISTLTAPGTLERPAALAFNPDPGDDSLYVVNTTTDQTDSIVRFDVQTLASETFASIGQGARDLAFGPDGSLCVTGGSPVGILCFDDQGEPVGPVPFVASGGGTSLIFTDIVVPLVPSLATPAMILLALLLLGAGGAAIARR